MSAPTSGSSGSSASSQPSAASGGSGTPVPGYYPDPSIPAYIRYWDGSAWVPGTSRPAPVDTADAVDAAPPPGEPGPAAPPPRPAGPAVDESGPMFLDEDPRAPVAEQWPTAASVPVPPEEHPAPRSAAEQPPQPGSRAPLARAQDAAAPWPAAAAPPERRLPPISWGAPGPQAGPAAPARPADGPAPVTPPRAGQYPPPAASELTPAQPPPFQRQSSPPLGQSAPRPQQFAPPPSPTPPQQGPQPHPQEPPSSPLVPAPAADPSAPSAGQPSPPWAAQVQDLARGEAGVTPWRPPVSHPFDSAQGTDRPGGLVRRFVARLVDTVVLAAVTALAAIPLGMAAYHHAKDKVDQARQTGETVKVWLIDGTTGVQLGAVVAAFLVAAILLEVLPTARWGRTLGKRLVGLRVLDIEAQIPPGFGRSVRRWLSRNVLDLLVVGVVGLVWCLFDRPWKQCWHDKAAHTFVAGT